MTSDIGEPKEGRQVNRLPCLFFQEEL